MEKIENNLGPISSVEKKENKIEKREIIMVCAWCKKVKTAGGSWESRKIPDGEIPSHGICSECMEKVLEENKRISEQFKKQGTFADCGFKIKQHNKAKNRKERKIKK